MLSAALLASACSGMTWRVPLLNHGARDHLQFLAEAMQAAPEERESLWKATTAEKLSTTNALYRALLQSVPGHSGYNAAAAEHELAGLLQRGPPPDIAAVAQVRLEELKATREMRAENQSLKERLAKVVDIERRLRSKER